MAETVLDSLVVKIEADTRGLEAGVSRTTASLQGLETFAGRAHGATLELDGIAGGMANELGAAAERASDRMAGAFARMARSGRLSFEGLRDAALAAIAEIVANLLSVGIRNIFGSVFSTVLLPGRAGGGAVSPAQAYVVGERGPELFVPQVAGRITASSAAAQFREPPSRGRAAITINVQGAGDGEALRQSSSQVALAVRRALMRAERSL